MNIDEILIKYANLKQENASLKEKGAKMANASKKLGTALDIIIDWIMDLNFSYDNIPDEYERYKSQIESMSMEDGLKYILLKEAEKYHTTDEP